ncbi:MAG TPA: GTPase Era [Polyangia bacterium]|jgi:GTP-binding protein Era|nr:GTPase Era [Polyangia bacterium]
MFRAGLIAIVGLPNVGKSTLMNRILGQKIAIASPRPQTTRNRILGIHNTPEAQLVLVDTPGLPGLGRAATGRRTELGRYMREESLAALASVDAVLVIIEAPQRERLARTVEKGYQIGAEYRFLLGALQENKKPTVLALNKVDAARDKRALLPVLDAWQKTHPFRALVPISATTGEGVDRLESELIAVLPEGERLFPEDVVTDRAERWLAAEMVREQVFLLTRQEVPYAVAVTIDTFEERPAHDDHPADVFIEAAIHVEKEAQKRILIGEGGRMVREIGSRARGEISQLLDCPVHLKLFVRVEPEWTTDLRGLRKMGYE